MSSGLNDSTASADPEVKGESPYPGSHAMPRWGVGKLIEPPKFALRSWPLLLGPGLVMGAAAIGGGEWLTGPVNTARYGGSLLWLATFSILGQTLYNIEISRYTLYTGEPIFTGKFRTLPGPMFWLVLYLLLDVGSFLPYLASNAAIPLYAMMFGELPVLSRDATTLQVMACVIFLLGLVPLMVGGKVYNSLKAVMTFKLIVVFGFLMFLAIFYSNWDTWREIGLGFFQVGSVPVKSADPADTAPHVANIFTALFSGEGFPTLDLSMIGFLAAMAAISGNGGLTNAPISNYTRDQGWGMGREVGAIPSITGGHKIELSHVGKVFHVTAKTLERWKGWVRHVQREQLAVWMPACFLGIALPSMLSLQFLQRGIDLRGDKWLAAGMTADGVAKAVGGSWGSVFWYLTLFCGFLVLGTSTVATADGVLRRWVDVFWTAIPRMHSWDTKHIGRFYFGVMMLYAAFGIFMLTMVKGDRLLVWSTNIYNYALGFSCLHVVAVNRLLMPRELRPGWLRCLGLVAAATFFIGIAVLTTLDSAGAFK